MIIVVLLSISVIQANFLTKIMVNFKEKILNLVIKSMVNIKVEAQNYRLKINNHLRICTLTKIKI